MPPAQAVGEGRPSSIGDYIEAPPLADPGGGGEWPSDDAADKAICIDAASGAGERLDRFLASRLADVSRSRIQQWIALGAVECEQRPLSAKSRLNGSEQLIVTPLPREADRAFEPDDVDFDIVFEDDCLLVVDKPVGLVTHPAPGNWRSTLLNGLLARRPQQAMLPRAGIVHRLDKDTSGLLVVGKSERACAALVAQLADHSLSRRYIAFVSGRPDPQGVIDLPIGRDARNRTRMAVVDGATGKPAVTHYQRLAVGHEASGAPMALMGVQLETGRTHQIRVHFGHLGMPLLGDAVYGGSQRSISRQALHAAALGGVHPEDATRVFSCTSALPADLRQLATTTLGDPSSAGLQGDVQDIVRTWLAASTAAAGAPSIGAPASARPAVATGARGRRR